MTFIRNFNKKLLKKCELSLASKKELRVVNTVVAKQKEDTGFFKIRRYFSSSPLLLQTELTGQVYGCTFDQIKY